MHSSDFPYVTKCIVCAPNYTQTIHKLYTNYTLKRSKPYTKGGGKPYTERYMEAFKTLHCNGALFT